MKQALSRTIGLMAIGSALLYTTFVLASFNTNSFALSLFFTITTILGIIPTIIHIINNWTHEKPRLEPILRQNRLPSVAILIPTWKEPLYILDATIQSIINQNYPKSKMLIVVSDDDHNDEVKVLCHFLANKYRINLIYVNPPVKNSQERRGEGKAGNLNYAYDLIKNEPAIQYIETRDADDIVGDENFLRHTIGKLERNNKLAFVQTIKDAVVSHKDPFSNREKMFYRSLMINKNSSNSSFPCGSGLVWRKQALADIGGFPTWNLVEDVESGITALRKGWKGLYLPIVGAIAQVGNEDIPNMYKQRGVWAMDSIRSLFWGKKKGLNILQKIQFSETGIFYLFSAMMFFQAFVPGITLITGKSPIIANPFVYFIHLATYLLSTYLFIWSIKRDKKIKDFNIIKGMKTSFGLGPVYLKALIDVLSFGKLRKPKYVVTLKTIKNGLYLQYVLPQLFLVVFLFGAVLFSIYNKTINNAPLDIASIFWSLFMIEIYFDIVKLSWFNYKPQLNISTKLQKLNFIEAK